MLSLTLRHRAWVAISMLAACSSPTGVEPLTVSLRAVVLATEAERSAWPATPTVLGGPTLRIRGIAFVGCGGVRGSATRHREVVRVDISADDATGPCLANVSAWVPFEATVSGLSADTYQVRVTVAGHEGHAAWRVAVGSP